MTENHKDKINITIYYILLLFTIITVIFTLYNSYRYFKLKKELVPKIEVYGNKIIDNSIKKLNKDFKSLEEIANSIATDLEKGNINTDKIPDYLKEKLKQDISIKGLGVLYKPYKFKKDTKLYAPYVTQSKESTDLFQIEKKYDYTKRKLYKDTLNQTKPVWSDPYYSNINNSMITEYLIPFYSPEDKEKKEPIGLIIANYSLKNIQRFLNNLPLISTSYAFIMNNKGMLLAYPNKDYLKEGKNLSDIAKDNNNLGLYRLSKKILKDKSGFYKYNSDLDKQHAYAFSRVIPTNNWIFSIILLKNEILPNYAEKVRSNLIWLITSILLFLITISSLILKVYKGNTKKLWAWSIIISLLLTSAIISLWYVQLYLTIPSMNLDTKIMDQATLSKYLSNPEHHYNSNNILQNSINVPTGVLINHIDMSKSDTVNLAGTLWQKYPYNKGKMPKVDIGFIFPLAAEINKKIISSREDYKSKHVISWDFNAELYQKFNYRKFPFDYRYIKVNIIPEDIKSNITLTPDLASYLINNPTALPGINSNLKSSTLGWNILRSYFSYSKTNTENNIIINLKSINKPQLQFNIIARRKFIDAFISYLLPLFLALIFLFLVLRSSAIGILKKPTDVGSMLNPIALTISIFSLVVFPHYSLRFNLGKQPLFYLEYFYIIAYIVMTLSLIIIFNIVTDSKNKLITYKNVLIPQVLYFPVFLILYFLITLWSLY